MKSKGFSLIELMVIVVIIGVLASIAVPSYKSYIMRAARSDCMAALLDIMRAQENFFSDNHTYQASLDGLNYSLANTVGRYTIKAEKCSGHELIDCVQLTATPIGSQAEEGILVYNSLGERKYRGNDGWPK